MPAKPPLVALVPSLKTAGLAMLSAHDSPVSAWKRENHERRKVPKYSLPKHSPRAAHMAAAGVGSAVREVLSVLRQRVEQLARRKQGLGSTRTRHGVEDCQVGLAIKVLVTAERRDAGDGIDPWAVEGVVPAGGGVVRVVEGVDVRVERLAVGIVALRAGEACAELEGMDGWREGGRWCRERE